MTADSPSENGSFQTEVNKLNRSSWKVTHNQVTKPDNAYRGS